MTEMILQTVPAKTATLIATRLSSCSSMAGNNGAVCITWSSSYQDHRLYSHCPCSLGRNRRSRERVRYKGLLPGFGPQIWRHSQLNSKASAGLALSLAVRKASKAGPWGQCSRIAPALIFSIPLQLPNRFASLPQQYCALAPEG